jgi:short-subunit dehydrogenase
MGIFAFKDKTIVVTGASSGIGKALAFRLASQGAWLALAARNAERLQSVAEECCQRGAKALALPTNVANEEQCQALIQRTYEEYGQIDMLINNAGITVASTLEDLPNLTLFKQVIDVNFYGTVYCSYYALPYLKKTKGRLVNISSLGGKLAIPGNTSYIASKFAVMGFSDSLRMELAWLKQGVSVTAICPYWVVTEFHEHLMNKDGQPKGPSGRAIYTRKMMTADECAKITLKAALKRKREVMMGPGSLVVWLKLLAPGLVDKFIVKTVLRRAVERTSRSVNMAE